MHVPYLDETELARNADTLMPTSEVDTILALNYMHLMPESVASTICRPITSKLNSVLGAQRVVRDWAFGSSDTGAEDRAARWHVESQCLLAPAAPASTTPTKFWGNVPTNLKKAIVNRFAKTAPYAVRSEQKVHVPR